VHYQLGEFSTYPQSLRNSCAEFCSEFITATSVEMCRNTANKVDICLIKFSYTHAASASHIAHWARNRSPHPCPHFGTFHLHQLTGFCGPLFTFRACQFDSHIKMNLWQFPADGCQGCLEGFIDFTWNEGGFNKMLGYLKNLWHTCRFNGAIFKNILSQNIQLELKLFSYFKILLVNKKW